jgi:hypothetical protein
VAGVLTSRQDLAGNVQEVTTACIPAPINLPSTVGSTMSTLYNSASRFSTFAGEHSAPPRFSRCCSVTSRARTLRAWATITSWPNRSSSGSLCLSRLIGESSRKDDQLDARTLARLARIDPELLGPVRHRSAKAQIHLTKLLVCLDCGFSQFMVPESELPLLARQWDHSGPQYDGVYLLPINFFPEMTVSTAVSSSLPAFAFTT